MGHYNDGASAQDRRLFAKLAAEESYYLGFNSDIDAIKRGIDTITKTLIRIEGKVDKLGLTSQEVLDKIAAVDQEVTAGSVDTQALTAAIAGLSDSVNKEIADFQAWLGTQSIPLEVANNLTVLLGKVQSAHATIVQAATSVAATTAAVTAADPGVPTPPVVNT